MTFGHQQLTQHDEVEPYLKIFFGQFWPKKFWPIFPILAKTFLVQNWPNFFFIIQSGYGEQTLYYKKF